MGAGRRAWWRPTVALFAAALLCGPARGQAVGVEPDEPPLFPPLVVLPQPVAALCVGAAAGTNGWASVATLVAGEHPLVRVWSLEGPFAGEHGRALAGTLTLLPTGANPGLSAGLTALATAKAGEELACWQLVNTDEVQKIPAAVLEWVQDGKGIGVGSLDLEAFIRVLVTASRTSNEAFVRAARRDLIYWHLFHEPAKHRGEVVQFEGRLKQLRRYDPPPEAVAEGVRDQYEGWMFDPELYGANPVMIVFTELPPGLELAEKMERRVRFAGYFFKKFRYKARDSRGTLHDVPMLVGRTVTLLGGPAEEAAAEDDWARRLLPLFLALVGGTIVAVVALTLWFRHTDRRVHRRIEAVRNNGEFVPPPPDEGGAAG